MIVALAAYVGGALYNGDVAVKKADSIEVLGKLKDIQENGGKFELTQNDLNDISSLYFAKPKTKGDMTLKGVNIEMVDDKLLMVAPISYKNLNLVFSSKGKLNFSNGDIVFDAENFKIGKVKIPKGLVVSQISKLDNKNISVQDNSIRIDTSVLPFKIEEFKITDNKILGAAEKIDKAAGGKDTNIIDLVIKENPQTKSKKVILKEAEKGLRAAKSQLETSKEDQVISKMISTITMMNEDPSFDASVDIASVKADYKRLDSASQDRVKVALVTNVDPSSIGVLKETFGM
jgi:uncharacterized protein YpmS